MKSRRETRRGGRPSPHFVLSNRTEQNTYIKLDVEGALSMKDLSKHFLKEIKTVSIENFSVKIKPPYFLPPVFFYFYVFTEEFHSLLCFHHSYFVGEISA